MCGGGWKVRGKRQANHINNPGISTGGCKEMEKAYLKEARKELMGGGALVKFHGLQGLKGYLPVKKEVCISLLQHLGLPFPEDGFSP